MLNKQLILSAASVILSLSIGNAQAGSLSNGLWTPSGCGERPAAPTVNDQSVEGFNASVAAINEWQQRSKPYFECLIKEANADNNAIADSANKAQDDFRAKVQAIGAEVDAAKQKLEK